MSLTTTARAWLVVAHGGGRWSGSEICREIPGEKENSLYVALMRMVDGQFLRLHERDQQNRSQRFSVAPGSYVPRGLLISEVLEAFGLTLREGLEDAKVLRQTTVAEVLQFGSERAAA